MKVRPATGKLVEAIAAGDALSRPHLIGSRSLVNSRKLCSVTKPDEKGN
jgi:hypothetical protein